MDMVRTTMEFTFEAVARFDGIERQWYPGVKTFLDGSFYNWIEYNLGFDEERFAMPYARLFREEYIKEHVASFEYWKTNLPPAIS